MNQKLTELRNKLKQVWAERTKAQKGLIIGGVAALLLFTALGAYLSSNPNLVPLYKDLSPQETGQIKETLDSQGITSKIADNGATIMVPSEMVDTLKVELAAEGIPNSGVIDYSFFGQNIGFGMTDNEFDVLKLKATQTELSNLMKGIEGVHDAKVMINLPKESVFVNEDNGTSTASIVLSMKPGIQLDQTKVNALYHLVSKSVPGLSTDNIVIMDQDFEYFDLKSNKNIPIVENISTQHDLKTKIERDIQRQVQKMLGTMMGQDKVVVSVTADLDFTQENREENIVEPVDKENMEGLAVSVERITETYTGEGAPEGGVTGAGEDDVLGYEAVQGAGTGDYEKIEERINNEVNRVKKEIVESPYKVRDLGIQVMVEPPEAEDPNSLSAESVNDIEQLLGTIIRTSINKDESEEPLTDEQVGEKISVSVQPFAGKINMLDETKTSLPVWLYAAGGILLLIIIILLFLLFRKNRKADEEYEEEDIFVQEKIILPDVNAEHESETSVRKKQLEKMAREKPEDFAKLLRSWLTEE
ncbi:flagellar M-ring protein FliF [Metabacillus idriensis]|uniref:flagellar basal-body MS-ring/collar protein FliF n=1 Tax=Metabacillus idriensis TaxID=324768 RepID=UPI0020423720|nr:flagellar basal-body MS-ring/collar protein FliF [Metabacillus idriensis]MCM3594304.1 flagellar M-ring protein FliF [Metabacillus idriensis]